MTTVLRPERPFDRHEALLAQRTLFYRHAPSTQTDAPAALFLHGLGGSALNWTDFMGRMSNRLDCYALDLHGFGSSPPPRDGDMTPRGHARAAADFILERDLGPVHVFGNSMGGAVSVQLAARRPDLVRSVTLISPALPSLTYATKGNVHLPVISVPGVGERLVPKFVETTSPEERVQATIDGTFADPSRMPADRLSEAIGEVEARDARPYANDAFLSSLRGLMRTYFDPGPQRPWKLAGEWWPPPCSSMALRSAGRLLELPIEQRSIFETPTWWFSRTAGMWPRWSTRSSSKRPGIASSRRLDS